ncbi:hypothetical protein GJ744_011149 [Endocarpon pusillum]|uniref:Uncharacterized protein n=1 Tax=Endocarpon pusillum TaxID=364733 RepID=A0A8H7E3M3_9EURO|nr:hypothetical protein GJ744_011149 [Endocarpon pusillum]
MQTVASLGGGKVRFFGSIDYLPYISDFVQGLDWTDVLLHVSFFLDLIPNETTILEITPFLHTLPREEALNHIISIADTKVLHALAIDREKLRLVTGIAEAFRASVSGYDPTPRDKGRETVVCGIVFGGSAGYAARGRGGEHWGGGEMVDDGGGDEEEAVRFHQ